MSLLWGCAAVALAGRPPWPDYPPAAAKAVCPATLPSVLASQIAPNLVLINRTVLAGLAVPGVAAVLGVVAVQTARSRSMESAAGLLDINVGPIPAGTIVAAGLYLGAGLLV